MRRFEIILEDSIAGVWSGENKAAALDAYARSRGYESFQSASEHDWKGKRIAAFAIGSQPVIIEDERES